MSNQCARKGKGALSSFLLLFLWPEGEGVAVDGRGPMKAERGKQKASGKKRRPKRLLLPLLFDPRKRRIFFGGLFWPPPTQQLVFSFSRLCNRKRGVSLLRGEATSRRRRRRRSLFVGRCKKDVLSGKIHLGFSSSSSSSCF